MWDCNLSILLGIQVQNFKSSLFIHPSPTDFSMHKCLIHTNIKCVRLSSHVTVLGKFLFFPSALEFGKCWLNTKDFYLLDWYRKYLLYLRIQEVLQDFRYPNVFISVGASEAVVMGNSKNERPRKKPQNATTLQTKIVQKIFLLKNCCLCHNDECYRFIPVFSLCR